MIRAAAIRPLPSRCLSLLLPISHSFRAHWTEPLELLNFDMVGSRGFCCEYRCSSHLLLTLLSRECLFVGVVLLLSPNEDLVLLRCGKHVIQFPVVLHGRDPPLSQLTDRLLLLWRGDRNKLKTCLRKQVLLLGCGDFRVVCGDGLACWHQHQCSHRSSDICQCR